MSSPLARTLALFVALSPVAALGGTLNVHPSLPASRSSEAPEPPQPRATTLPEAATPEIDGRSESDWRDAALERRRALESAEAALVACELREAPAPYRDFAGYYRPSAQWRRGYRWVEIKNCDDARLDVEHARREAEDFEEQARRRSVPPGWMR